MKSLGLRGLGHIIWKAWTEEYTLLQLPRIQSTNESQVTVTEILREVRYSSRLKSRTSLQCTPMSCLACSVVYGKTFLTSKECQAHLVFGEFVFLYKSEQTFVPRYLSQLFYSLQGSLWLDTNSPPPPHSCVHIPPGNFLIPVQDCRFWSYYTISKN